jgi:hypothetical protein
LAIIRYCTYAVSFIYTSLHWPMFMHQIVMYWSPTTQQSVFDTNKTMLVLYYSSSISLSRDRSIVSSNLHVFGERLSRKIYNVVVFPFAFHIAVQQPLKPLWSRLLLCDHEPSRPSTVLCFMSLLMSLLPISWEFVSEFPSPRVILSFFPPP